VLDPDTDDPFLYGRLLSPVEAQKHLGISASTVRTWHQRRKRTGLHAAGQDRHGKPLFYEADLLAMKQRKRIRDNQGRRHHTMNDVR
jgi:transposase